MVIAQPQKKEDGMKYRNTDEKWGDAVEVTAEDYRKQALIFGVDAEIEELDDGIYVDGERVAESIE
jgi:hypothetical protein